MDKISQSVVKKDHEPKMSGRSVYVGDYAGDGILTGKFLRSKLARAKLLSVEIPELPEGYYYVDQNDVPGDNNVNIVLDDTPVYARDTVEYIGEPIGMVVGTMATVGVVATRAAWRLSDDFATAMLPKRLITCSCASNIV